MAVNLKIVSQVVTSGTPGPAGKSAYQIAVDNGFEGTESEWLKELHPFKGWFGSVSELEEEHSAPSVGEYAYVKGATSSDPVKIYECSTEGSWSDSGRTVDTSTVQTFRSGEAVNDVDITDDSSDIEENSDKIPTAGAVSDALGNVEFSTGEKVKNVGIDREPTAGSDNLVKSGGVSLLADSVYEDIFEASRISQIEELSGTPVILEPTEVIDGYYNRYTKVFVPNNLTFKKYHLTQNKIYNFNLIAIGEDIVASIVIFKNNKPVYFGRKTGEISFIPNGFEDLVVYTDVVVKEYSITTAKIGDGSITTAKIGDGSITTAKIGDEAVIESKTVFFEKSRNILSVPPVTGVIAETGFYPNFSNYTSYLQVPIKPNTVYVLSCDGVQYNIYRIRSLNDSKEIITNSYETGIQSYTTTADAAYIDISLLNSSIEGKTIQLEENEVTPYIKPYIFKPEYLDFDKIKDNSVSGSKIKDNSVSGSKIKDGELTLQKTNFGTLGKNLFNLNTVVVGILYNGNILVNTYENFRTSALIPIKPSTIYRFSNNGQASSVFGLRIAQYAADGVTVTSYNNQFNSSTLITDENASYLRVCFNTNTISDFTKCQVEEGNEVTSFLPYGYYIDKSVIIEEEKDKPILLSTGVDISLPDKIYAVVGDTIQLFYNGMIKAVDPFIFNIITNCSKGAMYPRYWEYTPNTGDVGTTTFTLKVMDNNRNVIAQKSCTLETVASPVSPANDIHIACFGDSLTAGGYWPSECNRRLTGSGGTPAGNELSNISFVGVKEKDGTHYHGGSGWSWYHYTTANQLAFRFVLSGTPQLGMGAVYSNNGHQYTIIEIINDTILCSVVSDGTPTTQENIEHYRPSSSGTLTKVGGTGDTALTFTSNAPDSQNPLWDYTNNKMTFIPYAQNYCGGQIDVVYVFLTWNNPMTNWKTDFSNMIVHMNTFANTLHSEFPNAKLKVMAVQFPSIKRAMPNYGASGNAHSDIYGMLVSVFNMNKVYQDWCNEAERSSWCEFVNVASQFDSDYCMDIHEKNVNTRCSQKEYVVSNGVHPLIPEGYYQIADVVYRNIVANFCQ